MGKKAEKDAADLAFQFVAHERRIQRMKGNITLYRPHLSGKQASDISELISGHEDVIEARQKLVLDQMDPPVPRHLTLLPDDYREFFAQAKAIKCMKITMLGCKTTELSR